MSRYYTASLNGTLTNAGGNTDLIEVLPADDKPVKLRGMKLGQLSEVGDAAEEGVSITIYRFTATVTSGSGGSAITASPLDVADAAFGGAVEMNNTTVATTSGASTILEELAWNIRSSPFETWWPDFAPIFKQGEALIVRLNTTPADDITASLTFYLEEM
jgi:hypothetical protein